MKPSVEVCLSYAVSTCQFEDDATAQIAYDKLTRSLAEFNKFKNDKTDTVEIDTLNGRATFRLEVIHSIALNNSVSFEKALREKLTIEKTARAMREEMGLPEPPR